MLGAITGWLKYYYPIDFMAETMNVFIDNSDKLNMYLAVVEDMDIDILPPDVNESGERFARDEKDIRFGLRGIKNLGKTAELIIEERKERGKFKDYQEFAVRMAKHQNIDKKVLDGLIYSGALDSFEGSRSAKLEVLSLILDEAKKQRDEYNSGQVTFFDTNPEFNDARKIVVPNTEEFEKRYKLEKEKEYAGFYISEHPLDDYAKYFKHENIIEIGDLLPDTSEEDEESEEIAEIVAESYDNKRVKVAGIVRDKKVFYTKKDNKPLYSFQVEGRSGTIKSVMFADKIELIGEKIEDGNIIILEGIVKNNDFGLQIIADEVIDIEQLKINDNKKQILAINLTNEAQLNKLNNEILNTNAYQGDIPVYVNLNGRALKSNKGVNLNIAVISKLDNMFGDNYKILYK